MVAGGDVPGRPALIYLALRARGESLRMMLHFAQIPFEDVVVPLQDWPDMKPSMPPGPGAEFPGREKGNRALPVLRLPSGELLPESRDIAHWIARSAGPPLLPPDAAGMAEASELFDASGSLPLFWPTACLCRFPEAIAEKLMRGEDLGDARFGDAAATTVQSWLAGQPGWDMVRPALDGWDRRLEQKPADQLFFGGSEPHYGDFGLFASFTAALELLGREGAMTGRSGRWVSWYDAMAALPAVAGYLEQRPPSQGYPGSIAASHPEPAARPGAEGVRL